MSVAVSRWPVFAEDEVEAVSNILRSGRVNAWTGSHVAEFEQAYADALGRRYAVALSNGTLALELAMVALGIGPGDEVIVTPRSFVASAAAPALAGAVPVFADVDPDSQNLTAQTIAAAITPRTRAVVPVHLAGWPCDMEPIMALAARHDLAVVEDCAQAHGAAIAGRPAGSFGTLAAFSFCQDKIISTGGEGGMLLMDDEKLWRRAWSHKDHGKSFRAVFETVHPPGFRWVHEAIGTNWRMTSIQAVLGSMQLARLEETLEKRARNAGLLAEALGELPALRIPLPPPWIRHAWYRFYAFVEPGQLASGWTRDRILETIAAAGVPCFSGSCPEIYLERAFADRGWGPPHPLPVARALGETSFAFLVDTTLEEPAMRAAAAVIREVVAAASLEAARPTSRIVR